MQVQHRNRTIRASSNRKVNPLDVPGQVFIPGRRKRTKRALEGLLAGVPQIVPLALENVRRQVAADSTERRVRLLAGADHLALEDARHPLRTFPCQSDGLRAQQSLI